MFAFVKATTEDNQTILINLSKMTIIYPLEIDDIPYTGIRFSDGRENVRVKESLDYFEQAITNAIQKE